MGTSETKLRVRGLRVLVKEGDNYTVTTESGLVITRIEPTTLITATVVAVGPGIDDVSPGDRVLYRPMFGREWHDGLFLVDYDNLEGVQTGTSELLAL